MDTCGPGAHSDESPGKVGRTLCEHRPGSPDVTARSPSSLPGAGGLWCLMSARLQCDFKVHDSMKIDIKMVPP